MLKITACPRPANAFLDSYADSGAYTDCYCMTVAGTVTLTQYVYAFYTSRLFNIERHLLALLAKKPSTDQEAQALANAGVDQFAIWAVEQRGVSQLLLRQIGGPTRSWLMVESFVEDRSTHSRLYFGSAFVPHSRDASGRPAFSWAFHALSGFHRLYTKALMRAAYARLMAAQFRS